MEFFYTIHFKQLGQHKELQRQSQMTRHYDHAFKNCTEIASSKLEEPLDVGIKVRNVCAECRWFGTKVGEVWLFCCLNSASSFLSAVFNCCHIFPPIVPVLFSSDHKPFAGNVGDVRFASSVRGKQRCMLTVRLACAVLCCAALCCAALCCAVLTVRAQLQNSR